MGININTTELEQLLDMMPADQNVMLAGKHGIGKSQILTQYFEEKGMRVVALFLGQMSDPGDLIGLPNKDPQTGKTTFMPPYWFPMDGQPVVLFLDELNRARPEVLQTIMDLALNRKLAGRSLPEGSRLISAVNDGEEYQLTDLDPALVSRFNVYTFRPSADEWLLWAAKNDVDGRVIDFIQDESTWLDGNMGETAQIDAGLEKTPDRRGWKKVSDTIKGAESLGNIHKKVIAGIIGVKAANAFFSHAQNNQMLGGRDILDDFDKYQDKLKKYRLDQISKLNESIFRALETGDYDKAKAKKNIKQYVDLLQSLPSKEAMAHFVSIIKDNQSMYQKTIFFLTSQVPEVYQTIFAFVQQL